MKRILFSTVLLCISAVFCGAQEHGDPPIRRDPSVRELPATTGWIRYTSPAGRYNVLMPTAPTLSTQDSKTADGVKFLQYMASATNDTELCLIGYFDHVSGSTFSFDKARDGFVGAVNGTLVNETSISLGGYPGRELKVVGKAADGVEYILRVRIYDVKNRVYVVQFIIASSADADAVVNADARKYFDSFSVSETP
jgi:hypothetical protein